MSDDLPVTGPKLRDLIDKLRIEWKNLTSSKKDFVAKNSLKEFNNKEIEVLQEFLQVMEKYYETYFEVLMSRGNPPDYFYQIANDMILARDRLNQLGAHVDKKKQFNDPEIEKSLASRIKADKDRKRALFFEQERE